MNKKIMSVFICLLFIGMIPMVAGMNNYADEPELEVNDEQTSPVIELELAGQPPHIGIAINIHNIGDTDATDVDWSIIFDGIFLGLGIKKISGSISIISAGDYEIVRSGWIFGFGHTTITISAECAEGSSDELVLQARIIGIFLLW